MCPCSTCRRLTEALPPFASMTWGGIQHRLKVAMQLGPYTACCNTATAGLPHLASCPVRVEGNSTRNEVMSSWWGVASWFAHALCGFNMCNRYVKLTFHARNGCPRCVNILSIGQQSSQCSHHSIGEENPPCKGMIVATCVLLSFALKEGTFIYPLFNSDGFLSWELCEKLFVSLTFNPRPKNSSEEPEVEEMEG